MRFIMTARPGKDTKPQDPNAAMDEKLFSDYMRYNEELHKAGVLVAAEGLNPAGRGARIEVKNGKRAVVDGPFTPHGFAPDLRSRTAADDGWQRRTLRRPEH